MEAASAGALEHEAAAVSQAHLVRVSEPALRDDLVEYLRGGGWAVEAEGIDGLRASWWRPRARDTDRVNLRFSVAVWRAMHDEVETTLELEGAREEEDLPAAEAEPALVSPETLSHQLRTPLTSILGYLELLLSDEAGPLGQTQRRYLETVERNARRLAQTTVEVESLARGDAEAATG